MKPETLTTVPTPGEAQWIDGELVRNLMRTQRSTQALLLLLVPLYLGVLWDDVPPQHLLTWAVFTSLVIVARLAVTSKYMRKVMPLSGPVHRAFFNRYRALWAVNAAMWGLTTLLFFDRAPLPDQSVCWLILAGLSIFSVNSLSSDLSTIRAYLDTVAGVALAVMLWRSGVELQFQGPAHHHWMVVLVLLCWISLRQAGTRMHATHRRNFELQYRNTQLIESLTRQTQAALDAVEIKNRFLASAAHDLRQPVHALGLYAGWLGSEPELVHELAPKIVESTKAVNTLFDSLFDLVRLDSGKMKLTIEEVPIERLLYDLELRYRPLAQAKGLDFRVHAVPGSAQSDPIALQRIVGNLISNAIKYTPRGGVLVASRNTRSGVRIEVWDTGLGIAPVHQREIFREFYKVPNHPGTEDGFGLGLHIVQRLTTILGHPLQLSSRPGRGTVFRLLLTPTDAKAAAVRAAAPIQLASRPWVRA